MAAGVYTLEVEQGATKRITVVYQSADGTPVDLTGYSGRGALRLRLSDVDPLAEFVVTIPTPTSGEVVIELPADSLVGNAAIRGKTYAEKTAAMYDIELYTADDADVIRLLNGPCNISPEVTR